MNVRDTSSGHLVELRGRRGLLPICAHAQASERPTDPTNLRLLLVADVLLRVVELEGLQALTALCGLADGAAKELLQLADQCGIHHPTTVSRSADAGGVFSGPLGVHLLAAPQGNPMGVALRVGQVTASRDVTDRLYTHPLAGRLALLSRPYPQPVELNLAAVTEAEETLRRWRAKVADWAHSPSHPVPPGISERAYGYITNDLDTPSVLQLLAEIEAEGNLSAGAKFEAFVYLDRVLALELTQEIGR